MFNEFDIAAFERACRYLNDELHPAVPRKWEVDPEKLAAALDRAGIVGLEHARKSSR